MVKLENPIIAALDVDSADVCIQLAKQLAGRVGALKIGPRLVVRYGADLVSKLATHAPVFVDNKYLDIPSTMEGAIRATFASGATFATVHAWAGAEALERLAKVERELNTERPFKILVVTVLTSFAEDRLAPGLTAQPIAQHVQGLAQMTFACGLTGVVCSPHEAASLREMNRQAFLVTPGVRLASDAKGDQVRVETPAQALKNGASALVIGRPIIEAKDPASATEAILASLGSRQ